MLYRHLRRVTSSYTPLVTLIEGRVESGIHEVQFDAKALERGVHMIALPYFSKPLVALTLVLMACVVVLAGCKCCNCDTRPQPANIGAPRDSFPRWSERTAIVHTNAVRLSPNDWKSKYLHLDESSPVLATYGPAKPVYWNYDLNRASRSHSEDMAATGQLSHNSSDGTSFSARIISFYPAANIAGENVGGGASTSLQAVTMWIIDDGGPDHSYPGSGHRDIIMDRAARELGTGNVGSMWTQDFVSNSPMHAPPVVCATHDFIADGMITFLLNYHDSTGKAPALATVNLDGVEHTMAVETGAPASGTYSLLVAKANQCRSYFFYVIDGSGNGWRYPGPGLFKTTGEGGCSEEYNEAG